MKWARVTWFPEHGAEKVHADDIELFGDGIQGYVVAIISEEEKWVVIELNGERVRVDKSLVIECKEPQFKLGDFVKTKPPRTKKKGVVSNITWHFEKSEPLYFLTVSGQQLKSRYLTKEIEIA